VLNSLRLAFGLLTALPVRRRPTVDARSAGVAIALAPLTTLPTVALLALAHLAVAAGAPPVLMAALVVTAATLYTRAMHLDGLADTADGLSAGYDAATSLRAMKASDVGPSGVAAVVLALLVQVAALSTLVASPVGTALAAAAVIASRHSLAWACRRGVPAAQPQGLGALVAGSVGRPALAAAAIACAWAGSLLVAGAGALGDAGHGPLWWQGPVVTAAAVLGAEILVRRCRTRLGGITGDVLGAAVEVGLCSALVVAALLDGLL
jgi:adenosylcobinamide-GDP ribazoletransferase